MRRRKPRKAPRPKQVEQAHQKAVVEAMRAARMNFCAVVVDSITSAWTGAKAVALGYVKGDPDVRIYDPPPAHPECFATALEMKTPDEAPKSSRAHRWKGCKPHQKERLAMLEARGWLIIVAYGYEDAMRKLAAAGYPVRGHAGSEVAA